MAEAFVDWRLTTGLAAACVLASPAALLLTQLPEVGQPLVLALIATALALLFVAARQRARQQGGHAGARFATACAWLLVAAVAAITVAGLLGGDLDILPALMLGPPLFLVAVGLLAWAAVARRRADLA